MLIPGGLGHPGYLWRSRTPAFVTTRNGTVLSCPDSFEVPSFCNRHPLTPFSERQYEGGSVDETIIAVCEGMLDPQQLLRPARRRAQRQNELDCFCDIEDGVLTPWDSLCFGGEPEGDQQDRGGTRPSKAGTAKEAGKRDAAWQRGPTQEVLVAGGTAWEQRESWQMTLREWTELRKELSRRADTDGLKALGGVSAQNAHRHSVQEALRQGKPVPPDVLKDYPDLARSNEKLDLPVKPITQDDSAAKPVASTPPTVQRPAPLPSATLPPLRTSAGVTSSQPTPMCPKCGRPLTLRQIRLINSIRRFWACSGYPACRFTKDER